MLIENMLLYCMNQWDSDGKNTAWRTIIWLEDNTLYIR